MQNFIRLCGRLFWIYLLFIETANAQSNVRDSSIGMVLICPAYSFQLPAADMAQRFGSNSTVGLAVSYKTRSQWLIEGNFSFIFGGTIKEKNLYQHLLTSQGLVVGSDGYYANLLLNERGYFTTLSLGRLIPALGPNPNSGFVFQAGAGFIQHKILVVDKKKTAPSVTGDYAKGYDRLTNGLLLREYAGYHYTGNRRLVNFFAGVELLQGFTQCRRDYDFDEQAPSDKRSRLDLLFGLRAGWMMPLYKEAPEKFYTY